MISMHDADSRSSLNAPAEAGQQDSSPPPRRGRPVGDYQAKRRELLTAAITVIAQDGYAGASLRKVARQAGYTTGAVTYYFANKEAMVTAVAECLFDEFDSFLVENHQGLDIKSILLQWLDWASYEDSNHWQVLFQLLAHARHEPAFANVLRKRYARFRQTLTSLLQREQSQGKVRGDIPPDLLADLLCATCDGWMMMMPIEPDRFDSSRIQALLSATISLMTPALPKPHEPADKQ